MIERIFKFLTFALTISLVLPSAFASLYQKDLKTHLRWRIESAKDQIHINKKFNIIRIQTLNMDLYKKISKSISSKNINKQYFAKVDFSTKNYPEEPATIKVQLKDDTIELFNFYKESEKTYVLDFWINKELVNERKEAIEVLSAPKVVKVKKLVPKKVTKVKKASKPKVKKNVSINEIIKDPNSIKIASVKDRHITNGYKDFRYGAAFIWDYKSYIPEVAQDINLKRKIPAYFYPIKDREFSSDEKETHMQLTINLYKKEKWGLMAKSINLYEKKYGEDSNKELNDFLKANSILKKNLVDQNKGLMKSAINLLMGVEARTNDYELKRAVYRYVLQYYKNTHEYISILKLAKKYFIESKKSFDKEQTEYAALLILDSLAHLKQTKKIKKFVIDLKGQGILASQTVLAYLSFANLELGDTQKVIEEYEKNKAGLAKPIHPAILYNTAEAYFREAEFKKSLRLFDDFAADYSHLSVASNARLRIALSYEILAENLEKVKVLYENAINRSPVPQVRYEAKLRYIALMLARKERPTKLDKEAVAFFDQSPDEKEAMTYDLKKLLWLVRLRTFINSQEYEKALTYITSLPLQSLKIIEKRVFEGDGAEIIFGLIRQSYDVKNYARAVKVWEVYKNKYESKVARNPYMNFVICDSFLKLGMYKSFERSMSILKTIDRKVSRTFPVWVDRDEFSVASMIKELEVIKMIASSEWDKARKYLGRSGDKGLRKAEYYRLKVAYMMKEYPKAADLGEDLLTKSSVKSLLNKNEMSDVVLFYIESLNKGDDRARYVKASKALIKDLRKIKDDKIFKSVYERIAYLYIEHMASATGTNFTELMGLTGRFLNEFKNSEYKWRVSYLRGISLVNGIDLTEGKQHLQSLLKNMDVPEDIKDLARSELSALELTNNL